MGKTHSSEVSQMIDEAATGSVESRERLVESVYAQLRASARLQVASERSDHTLSATALVHEAYIRLAGPRRIPWQSRGHFYAAAAEAMRRVLLDHAKGRRRLKRGGGAPDQITLEEAGAVLADKTCTTRLSLIALDEAMSRFKDRDPRAAEVVRLKYYAGLETAQIALALGVSERTVKNDWALAKAWLQRELQEELGEANDAESRHAR